MSAVNIENGTGNGAYRAKVNKANELCTRSVTETIEHHTNHTDNRAYNLLFDVTPTGAGDVFLYIKNTGTRDYILESITLYAASAEAVEVYLNASGTPSGGSSATPANLAAGSPNTPVGTFQTGADITGLSGATKVTHLRKAADSESKEFNFDMDIILPPQKALYIAAVNGAINIVGHVAFYEDLED